MLKIVFFYEVYYTHACWITLILASTGKYRRHNYLYAIDSKCLSSVQIHEFSEISELCLFSYPYIYGYEI
jgi:hypothetical protein